MFVYFAQHNSYIPLKEEVNSETRFNFQEFVLLTFSHLLLCCTAGGGWAILRSNAGPDRAGTELTAEQQPASQLPPERVLLLPDPSRQPQNPHNSHQGKSLFSLSSSLLYFLFQIILPCLFLEAIFSRELFFRSQTASSMSEAHFDEFEHYNFDQDKAMRSGHSGKWKYLESFHSF